MTSSHATPGNEAIYALSWNSAQDGKIAYDPVNGSVIDANSAMEELMGRSRDELIGMSATELHPEDERERVVAVTGHERSGTTVHNGFHILRKGGEVVPVQIWSSGPTLLDGRGIAIVEFRDITLGLRNELQLSSQNWALSAFSGAAVALSRARTEQELLQSICDAITSESAYALAFVGVAEHDAGSCVRFAAVSGSASGYLEGLNLSWGENNVAGRGPLGTCIRTGETQILDDLGLAPNFAQWRDRAERIGIRSGLAVPLQIESGWRGALMVYSAKVGAFDAEPVKVFRHLGEHIVHGIEALRRKELLNTEHKRLERTQNQLLDALSASVGAMVAAMESRDPYTASHEGRVAEMSVAIGRAMGLNDWRLQGMRLAAMVHDLGKIAIPSELLTKPSRLTAEEFELFKAHPETGYVILKDVPFPWPVAQMVRQHHEKVDGSGYPHGLKGDELLLESKIIAVADIVEAMASDRPYRKSLGLEVALWEVESMAGTKLDADVVRVCAELFREKRLDVQGLNWLDRPISGAEAAVPSTTAKRGKSRRRTDPGSSRSF